MDARPGGFGPPAQSQPGQSQAAQSQPVQTGVAVPGAVVPPATVPTDDLHAVEADLARLNDLTISEHVGVFATIHQKLTNALAVTAAQGNQAVPTSLPSGSSGQGSPQNRSQPGRPAFQQRGR